MTDLATAQLDDAQDEIGQALRMPHGPARDAALMQVGARAMQMSVEVLIGEIINALHQGEKLAQHRPRNLDTEPAALAISILAQLRVTVDGLDAIATPIER